MAFYRFIGTPEAREGKKLIVDFSSIAVGTVIVDDWGDYQVGEVHKTWIPHTDTIIWEPCEDPRQSRTNRMLRLLND